MAGSLGSSALHQTYFLMSQEDHVKLPEFDFFLKEQECIPLIKKCRSLKDFKQVHGQILKMGLFWSSFCASNLLATCALSDWGSMDYACSIFRDIDDPGLCPINSP